MKTRTWLIVLGICAVAFGVLGYRSHYSSELIVASTYVKVDKSDANVKTYTSDKLGIVFEYYAINAGNPVQVKEVGDKIQLYTGAFPDETASEFFYVRVLSKTPEESLEESAIRSGLSIGKCYPSTRTYTNKDLSCDSGFLSEDPYTHKSFYFTPFVQDTYLANKEDWGNPNFKAVYWIQTLRFTK